MSIDIEDFKIRVLQGKGSFLPKEATIKQILDAFTSPVWAIRAEACVKAGTIGLQGANDSQEKLKVWEPPKEFLPGLTTIAQFDRHDACRMAAIETLRKYQATEEIYETLMKSLSNRHQDPYDSTSVPKSYSVEPYSINSILSSYIRSHQRLANSIESEILWLLIAIWVL